MQRRSDDPRIGQIKQSIKRLIAIGLALYVLTLTAPTSAQTATGTAVSGAYLLRGGVFMGTGNITVTDDLLYTLSVFRGDPLKAAQNASDVVSEAYTATARIDSRGEYSFPSVPLQPNDLYVVTTQYAGITQGTTPTTFDGKSLPAPQPITLYAGTNDPAKLVIAQTQQLISFPSPGVMRVVETMTVLNQGDRFYLSSAKTPDGSLIALSFPLPIGARGTAFNTRPTSRFYLGGDANMPIVQDTKPVMPGRAQDVTFSYQLPYAKGAPIDRDYMYPVTKFQLTLPNDALIVARGQPFTITQIKAQDTGRVLDLYVLENVTLKDGKRLIYMLDGAAQNREVAPPANNAGVIIAVIGAAVLLLLLVIGVFWFRARAAAGDN